MDRWQYTGMLAALSLGLSLCPAADQRPNILFLFGDQWRASAMGYAGDPNIKTPNLDKLTAAGLRFRNAVSVCPVCTPYRAALLTGRYPTTTGMFLNDLYLPSQELCMGEIMKAAGYDTGYIGKWHLDGHGRSAYIPPARRQGFDYWKAAECDHNYNQSHYYGGDSSEKQFWPGYDAFAQTKDAQAYLRAHARASKPFLLIVSYGVPHFPHDSAPPEYRTLYPADKIQLPPNVPEAMKERARREAVGYYAHCTALDKCIGDLMATLAETGLADNTILIFTSDHGEMIGAQGRRPFIKQVPWDESAHVPFLLRFPAVHGPQGREILEPIDTPDILPTLLGLASVPIPKTVEGQDLSSLVRGQRAATDRAALYMSISPFDRAANIPEYRAIRTARHTYARSLQGPWLLYNDQADPYQMTNLVGKAEYAALQKELDERLTAELNRIGDDFKPRQFYLGKFGYKLDHGAIPYGAGLTPTGIQSPRPQP